MKFEILKGNYTSPRITGEYKDCSLPMTFDQYSNCGYNCIRGDVEVLMYNGEKKKMEELKIGDKLWSYDLKTMKIKTSIIEKISKRYAKNIIKIEHNSNIKLYLTEEHLVWTKKGWIEAGKLTTKDNILRIWKGNIVNNDFWLTEEGRKKASQNMKMKWQEGKIPPGRYSKKRRQEISDRMKINNPSKNQNAKERLSKRAIEFWKSGKFKIGYKYGMGNYSNGQQELYNILDEMNVKYEKEYCFKANKKCPNKSRLFVDAFIPDKKIVIEYDGFPYHTFKETIKNDKLRDEWLKEKGITILRIRGNEIQDTKKCKELIRINHRKWYKIKRIQKFINWNTRKSYREGWVYDIELNDCHNFVAGGILVHNCQYCFSTFQRAIGQSAKNYLSKKVKKVSFKKFKSYFTELDNPKNPFRDYIKNRITMQWGGLSDPFCFIEEQEGLGYEILTFLKEIQYPINFSSKSNLLIRNPKYLELFKGMEKLWSYKASIITLDEKKASIIESGCPTPKQRIEVLKKLGEMGIWTIWRMRPFIIGLTDLDYEEQLKIAGEIGVKALSTEFFCLELRSMGVAKEKFDLISKVVGFDIVQFYKNISNTSGYLRLNRKIKEPYYKRMKELCDKYNINMHVSDAQGKEYSASGSCCGLPAKDGCPTLTNFYQCQFTEALNIAKRKGFVTWDDINKHNLGFYDIEMTKAPALNVGGSYQRERKCRMSILQNIKNHWNNPKDNNSPYKYFKGILFPDKLDENGNIIYKYKPYNN